MKTFSFTLLIIGASMSASAQRWQWPEKPQNLLALPKTTTGKELQKTMFGFTSSLGVKCIFCHVGEEGKEWSEFDFESDIKPTKNKARIMINMVKAINTQYVSTLHKDNTASLEVTCITCHHGNSLPISLEEKLKRTFDSQGIDSTIRQYRALREQLYGGFTYNFKEGTLLRLTDKILEDTTKVDEAIKVLRLNMEMYPSFAFSYVHLADIYEERGNTEAAIENYQQALKLNPKDERIKKRLEALEGKQ